MIRPSPNKFWIVTLAFFSISNVSAEGICVLKCRALNEQSSTKCEYWLPKDENSNTPRTIVIAGLTSSTSATDKLKHQDLIDCFFRSGIRNVEFRPDAGTSTKLCFIAGDSQPALICNEMKKVDVERTLKKHLVRAVPKSSRQ